MDLPGHCVAGRYELKELLGRGGMGAVFRAYDQREAREVALKRLFEQNGNDQIVLRLFEREFHTLRDLAHPRIIEVYDYGVDAGGAYYTMELLTGEDARSLGKIPWQRACELLRDVASSLALLHARRLIHCDVSPRNVRCTADGRAKLLDFGAMMPMGVAKRIVGTPPFIAPEMMNQQSLDARTDLYAVGALAYLLLTGRHAYPAQQPQQLRELWRRPLLAPNSIEPSVPAVLGELVVELLQLNRNARPPSAAVLMERLCSIAALPPEETANIALGYLSTPTLIGCNALLGSVRERLVAMLRGEGSVLTISGPSGSGRSRVLDACVLESKLLGLQVVRVDRADADAGAYAVTQVLCRQLFELSPTVAEQAAHLHGPTLAHVIGAQLPHVQPSATPPSRRQLLLALRDFILSVVRSLRLVITVDDAQSIDDFSLSLLAACAQKADRRGLCLLLTFNPDLESSTALNVVTGLAQQFTLSALSEPQTEALLENVFGSADHLLTIARRVHALARGNPRVIMLLATHLVERGIARYEAGSFVLPERLSEDALPATLAAAFEQRLRALDRDALELARVLALTDPSELPATRYVELTEHGDRSRTFRAIDQLIRIQLLEAQGERYRLTDPTWSSVLAAGSSAVERNALHGRLARVFEEGGTLTRRSYHLLESEQPEPAIRLILAQFIKDPNEPRDPLTDYVPGLLDQLERAAHCAEALRLPAPWRIELWMKVSGASQFLGEVQRFMRVAPPILQRLQVESGLAAYDALDPNLEPMARLTQALTSVQQRFDATAEVDRGLQPIDAIRELARLCVMFSGMAAVAQDHRIVEQVPSLEPFVLLSPAVGAIHSMITGLRALAEGREDVGQAQVRGLIARLEQPDGAGLGELYRKSMHLGAVYALGLSEASAGVHGAAERMRLLEREPGHRVNAQRVYSACHLMQGDMEAASVANRRAELMMLQDGQQQRYPGTTLRSELLAYWLCGDLPGLKQVSERAAAMAERSNTWVTLRQLARSVYKQVQGDFAGASAALEPVMPQLQPLRSRDWVPAQAAWIQALTGLGRAQEASVFGRQCLEVCQRHGITASSRIAYATAEAVLASGDAEAAARMTDTLIANAERASVRGLLLGSLYELRARAALALGDQRGFDMFSERCRTEYRPDRNPALAVRYQRLFRSGVPQQRAELEPKQSLLPDDAAHSLATSFQTRLYECADAAARASCALTILMECTGAEQGYLYGVREGRLELVSALPDPTAPADLQSVLERRLACELEPEDASSVASAELLTLRADALQSIVVASRGEGQRVIAGLAALRCAAAAKLPDASVIECLASALLDHDDVDPATCLL